MFVCLDDLSIYLFLDLMLGCLDDLLIVLRFTCEFNITQYGDEDEVDTVTTVCRKESVKVSFETNVNYLSIIQYVAMSDN